MWWMWCHSPGMCHIVSILPCFQSISMVRSNKIGETSSPCLIPSGFWMEVWGCPLHGQKRRLRICICEWFCRRVRENHMVSRVPMIAFHLTVSMSKAFLSSMLKQHLFVVLILPWPFTISSAKMVLSLCTFLEQWLYGEGRGIPGLP